MIFEATIQFRATAENSERDKLVRSSYIIDGTDVFLDVEVLLFNDFGSYDDFQVESIKKSKIKEIANERVNEDDKLFLAELADIFVEDNGNEKELRYKIALFAKDIERAHSFVREFIKQGYNMQLRGIKQTKFLDVIHLNNNIK